MRSFVAASALLFAVVALTACKTAPAEPEPPAKPASTTTTTKDDTSGASTSTGSSASPAAQGTRDHGGGAKKGASGDPHDGSFTLAEATKDLKGAGAIVAKIETSKGSLQCKLFDDKAPITVANFIGLATGKRAWRDPTTSEWVKKPAYDGTGFHRIIKGFMIQGGDPKGDGTGEPGYVIKDEVWDGAKHDRAGLLCMANRGPNTNGAQFFITDDKAAHLDASYTIFGECAPVELVHEIAGVQTGRSDKPTTPVAIKSVTISRDEKKK